MILVTGASGHLGGAVVRQLIGEGRAVRIHVRDPERAQDLLSLGCDLAVGDILDRDSLTRACAGCSALIHCASGFLMWSRDIQREIIQPSVEGTRLALEAAAANGLKRVVYVSSSGTVAPARSPEVEIDESFALEKPHTPYLQGKAAAERWAIDYAARAPFPIIIINPGFILGPGFRRPSESVQVVADCVLRGQPFAFPGSWPITDVDDVAAGIVAALSAGRSAERYLLCGEQMRIIDLFRLVAELCGLPRPLGEAPLLLVRFFAAILGAWGRVVGRRPLLDSTVIGEWGGRYQNMPSRKAREELGFHPRPARAAIIRTIAWLLTRGFVPDARRARMKLSPEVEAAML